MPAEVIFMNLLNIKSEIMLHFGFMYILTLMHGTFTLGRPYMILSKLFPKWAFYQKIANMSTNLIRGI